MLGETPLRATNEPPTETVSKPVGMPSTVTSNALFGGVCPEAPSSASENSIRNTCASADANLSSGATMSSLVAWATFEAVPAVFPASALTR